MNVAIRFKSERHLLKLPAAATVADLQEQVQQATQLPPAQQLLRWGFPPQPIPTDQKQLVLRDIGCTNGQLILVDVAKTPTQPVYSISENSTSTPSSACPAVTPVSGAARHESPVVLTYSDSAHLQQQQQQPTAATEDSFIERELLAALAEAVAAAAKAPRPPVSSPPPKGYEFVRIPVPADDSCLFASVSLVAIPSISPKQLRDVAAAGILKDPERFNEVVLELPPQAYVKRLRSARSWGGYLELAVLAEELKHQLAVIDAESGRMDLYGEEFKGRRSFLLYDGIHYDPLVAYPQGLPRVPDAPLLAPNEMMTVFAADDAAAAAAAAAVGQEVHHQQGYVRAAGMEARCLACGELLKDNDDLRRHAKATGHQEFAHIQQ